MFLPVPSVRHRLLPVALPLLFAPALLPVPPAHAQAALPAPKTGERVSGKIAEGFGRFFGDVAAEWGLPKGSGGGAADVYVWEGDAYKPGRGRLAWATLRRALGGAGFEIEEFEKSDVRANIYLPDYGLSAVDESTRGSRIRLSAWMDYGYFRATNARAGTSVVGIWADLEQEKQAVVAYARAGFKAARQTEGVPPFVPGPNEVLVPGLDASAVGKSAAKPPAFPPLQKKRRAARGRVLDSAGRPIAGARIAAHTSLAGGLRTTTQGKTNAQGVYEFPLPQGAAQVVEASCEVTYDGQPVTLQLTPADGELDYFNADAGHVENFVLRMNAANAAGVRILRWDLPEDGKGAIQVKLAPDGPLLDGSRGKTLVFRFPNKATNTEVYLNGVPLGKYTMTATFFHDGEEAPLRLNATFDPEGKKLDRLPVAFKTQHNPYAASFGVERFEVTLRP